MQQLIYMTTFTSNMLSGAMQAFLAEPQAPGTPRAHEHQLPIQVSLYPSLSSS